MQQMRHMRPIHLIVLSSLCFGTGLTVSRLGLQQMHPMAYTGLRLVCAVFAFAAFYALWRNWSWPRDFRLWLVAGLLGVTGTAFPMLAIISSLQYMSSGLAAILATTGPAFAVVLAHFILADELINMRKIAGIGLALAGAVLLAMRGETGLPDATDANIMGYVLMLVALFASHASLVCARRYLRKYDIFDVVNIQMIVSALVLLPFVLTTLDLSAITDPGMATFTVIYGGLIGTFAAFTSRFVILKRFSATDAALIDYVVPIVTAIGGLLFADEELTLGMLLSAAVIMLGVALVRAQAKKIRT